MPDSLTPVSIESGNYTIIPKMDNLNISYVNGNPKLSIDWHKYIIETGDKIPQQAVSLTPAVMDAVFHDGFTRYNPLTSTELSGYPKITQNEMMVFVYSVFKNLVTNDLSISHDPDVPEDELMVE